MYYVAFNDPGDRSKCEPLVECETKDEARRFALEDSQRRWGVDKVMADSSLDIVVHLGYNEWCARVETPEGGSVEM